MAPARLAALLALTLAASACKDRHDEPPAPGPAPLASPSGIATTGAAPDASSAKPIPDKRRDRLVLLAAGDVSFGRMIGQILLREPDRALFASMDPLLRSADVRFANLEGPISDQGRETVSPENNLVFNGPPASAKVLARAGIDVVSTANNHAWDYGKNGLLETLSHLDRESVLHAGTGNTSEDAWKPAIVSRDGFVLAVIAVTDIWNQGPLSKHPAKEHVAAADPEALTRRIRALRSDPSIDAVVVSHHGGVEYDDEPLQRTRELARAALDAGADAFLGHHPHVAQGIAFHDGKPIVYSLGNLLMRMHSLHPETEMGLAVKLELSRGAPPRVFACPLRIHGIEPIPLGHDPRRKAYESAFSSRLASLSRRVGDASLGPFGVDGCAPVTPAPN